MIARLLRTAMLYLLVIWLSHETANAQGGTNITIKGKVTVSGSNESIPSVTIREKGGKAMAITDSNGVYSITAGSTSTLIFSSVGYLGADVPIAGRTEINVKLESATKELKDVLITALGITKERRAVG
jgi:hypothetical protein